jgi:hypothetical protein
MAQKPPAQKSIDVPAPTIGVDFAQLLHNDENADVTFRVVPEAAVDASVDHADSSMIDGEQCVKAHRLVLQVRNPELHHTKSRRAVSLYDIDQKEQRLLTCFPSRSHCYLTYRSPPVPLVRVAHSSSLCYLVPVLGYRVMVLDSYHVSQSCAHAVLVCL